MSTSKTLFCSIALAASGLLAQTPAGPPVLMRLYPVALDATGAADIMDTADAVDAVDAIEAMDANAVEEASPGSGT